MGEHPLRGKGREPEELLEGRPGVLDGVPLYRKDQVSKRQHTNMIKQDSKAFIPRMDKATQ